MHSARREFPPGILRGIDSLLIMEENPKSG